MTYMGLDPGLLGACASATGEHVTVVPMPIAGDRIDVHTLTELLRNVGLVILENAGNRHGQGAASVMTIGINWGMVLATLVSTKTPYEIVTPQKWQKEFGIKAPAGSTPKVRKALAVAKAKALFPDVSLLRTSACKVPSDGFADALLLMEYGRRLRK